MTSPTAVALSRAETVSMGTVDVKSGPVPVARHPTNTSAPTAVVAPPKHRGPRGREERARPRRQTPDEPERAARCRCPAEAERAEGRKRAHRGEEGHDW